MLSVPFVCYRLFVVTYISRWGPFSILDEDRLSLAQQVARLDLRDLSEGLARRDWVQTLRPHLHPPAEELLFEPPDETEPRDRRTLSPPAPVAHALVGAHEARVAPSQRIDARKLHLVLNRHPRSLQRAADRIRSARPKDVSVPVAPEDDLIQVREQDAPIRVHTNMRFAMFYVFGCLLSLSSSIGFEWAVGFTLSH